jgi:hypothetical protein
VAELLYETVLLFLSHLGIELKIDNDGDALLHFLDVVLATFLEARMLVGFLEFLGLLLLLAFGEDF